MGDGRPRLTTTRIPGRQLFSRSQSLLPMVGYATLPRLLDAPRLRAAGLAVRTDPSTAVPPRDADPSLLAAVRDALARGRFADPD